MAAETSQQAAEEEESMEEILHSIRDIIAEDGTTEGAEEVAEGEVKEEEAAPAEAEANPEAEAPQEEASAEADTPPAEEKADTAEEEVLELTEVVEEEAGEEGKDVLDDIDAALEASTKGEEETPAEPAPEEEAPADEAPPAELAPEETNTEKKEALVSNEPAAESTAAMKELVDSIPRADIESEPFRGGHTVEDLVIETLKPMLSEWLNENLPIIVKELVEKEIRKLVPRE